MRQVQEALRGIIAVSQDVYRPGDAAQDAAGQFAVYVTSTTEDEHWDDEARSLKTFVYMNLWSRTDPTEKAREIRRAMRAAGFGMAEETTGNTKGEARYAEGPKYFCVSWTWVLRECVDDGY